MNRMVEFESCSNCIYCDADEAVCIQLQCIHAGSVLKECYVPKESVREQGTWLQHYITTPTGGLHCVWECDGCGARVTERTKYCAECGRRMTE